MTHVVELKADRRDIVGKSSRRLARAGRVPAVLYGAGVDAVNLSVDRRDFERLMHSATVGSTLIDLHVEGRKDPVHCIIKEVRHDAVKGNVEHVDFWAVKMTRSLQTTVPITFVGSSEGERSGGVVMHALRELRVEARPKDLPEHIEVDLTPLEVGDSITVGDLTPPEGVTLLDDPDTVVASVMAPAVEVEVAPAVEEAVEVPEVGKETEAAEE